MIALMPAMPNLRHLELGYNDMRKLGSDDGQTSSISKMVLETLNFDGNALEEWRDIMMAIMPFKTSNTVFTA